MLDSRCRSHPQRRLQSVTRPQLSVNQASSAGGVSGAPSSASSDTVSRSVRTGRLVLNNYSTFALGSSFSLTRSHAPQNREKGNRTSATAEPQAFIRYRTVSLMVRRATATCRSTSAFRGRRIVVVLFQGTLLGW